MNVHNHHKFNIEGFEISCIYDLLSVYRMYGRLGDSTEINVRRVEDYIKEMKDLGKLVDGNEHFVSSTKMEVKMERVRFVYSFCESLTKHIIAQRPNAYDKVSVYISCLVNALKWANRMYGCDYIVIDTKELVPKQKMIPPVLVIPLDEVKKLLDPPKESLEEIKKNPFLRDCLFLAQTILYTSLRPSDAGNLRLENLEKKKGRWIVSSVNNKTGKQSFCIVPDAWAKEFKHRAEKVSIFNRPITAYVEQAERKDKRKTVGSVKKSERGKVKVYIEPKESLIFKYNQTEKINDDVYYARTYVKRLYKVLQLKDVPYKTYLREVVRICGLDFRSVVYRSVGKKKVREIFSHEDVTSYTLRRTSITRMLAGGLDTTLVKGASGHSSRSASFERYVDESNVLMGDDALSKYKNLNG